MPKYQNVRGRPDISEILGTFGPGWAIKPCHFIPPSIDVIAYWDVLGWIVVEADPPKRVALLRNHE